MQRIMILFLLGAISQWAYALPSDQSAPLKATSDQAEINQPALTATYIGNVDVTQGTTHLTADRLVIHLNAAHQVIEAIAYGNPAVYQTIPQQGKSLLTAQAATIDYFPPQHLVKLDGNAVVTQDGNRYTAPHIDYDTTAQIVISPPSAQGRTTIILPPHNAAKK